MNPEIDREGWPSGPWDNEPDKIQWRDETTGLPCLIVRNRMGGLCGYVGVSRDHKLYGKDFEEANALGAPAHGGLTYAARCVDGPENQTICHVVEPGEDDDVWWFGFDCGHFMDQMPQMLMVAAIFLSDLPESPGTYKTVEYVRDNIQQLAGWLSGQ